ncbi:amidase signature enzyme [Plenodomus tracheiphilus IPT5]|uniref:Amidase signature enzyme n=1 Tax=Plenodomus tracheiphilus IPT5 TaxID=1408161 RepID=A0A6A7AQX4_9PLEO|nr:amidase signature enzyme [Plenodomus tracheiphilus IPT5]
MLHQNASGEGGFNILEASVESHRAALEAGKVTSVDLVIAYLNRIATYDMCSGLNAFTVFNPNVLQEAEASDIRRSQGLPARSLEGIPYTIKDSYKVAGMSVTNGSPALKGVMSSEDSAIAAKLRAAGAVLLGKTNMPPMAAGGMQRGMYGRAESPYNSRYLTGAFSSGSSNGAATSVASSMAAFGMGSETVSSGRSPASNNGLVCYTPSKGLLSCRGLWPLYVTCDVPSPYARSVGDMMELLSVIATPDDNTRGDFIREQTHVEIPRPHATDYNSLKSPDALRGKRIGVPKLYVGGKDSDPHAKPTFVSEEVSQLWETTATDLQALGAELVYMDFPLITNYENDSISGEANNVDGRPADWNLLERGHLIAQAWNEFLVHNNDRNIKSLTDIKDSSMLFPKPKDYLPDKFLEVRNWIDYPGLPSLLSKIREKSIHDVEGMEKALKALESQRKRDLEDWMDNNRLDVVAFPAQGDVGLADLETNLESTTHSLRNGVKYSNGNRAVRHLGVPTISVPMGIMSKKGMPVNLTFAGKAYEDDRLLEYAYAFEQATKKRIPPPSTPALPTDIVPLRLPTGKLQRASERPRITAGAYAEIVPGRTDAMKIHIEGTATDFLSIKVYVDGDLLLDNPDNALTSDGHWSSMLLHEPKRPECLGWDLKPLRPKPVMCIAVAVGHCGVRAATMLWIPIPDGVEGQSRHNA